MESQGFLGTREFGVWEVLWSNGELGKHQVSLPLSLPALGRDAGTGFSKSRRFLVFLMAGEEFRHQVLPNPSRGRGKEGESKPLEQRGIWGHFPQISLLWTRQEVLNLNSSLNQGWLWGINLSILFPLPLLTTTNWLYKYSFSTVCILQIEGTAIPGAWNIPRGLWQGMKGTKGGKSLLSNLLFCAANVDVKTSSAVAVTLTKGFPPFWGQCCSVSLNLNFKCCFFFSQLLICAMRLLCSESFSENLFFLIYLLLCEKAESGCLFLQLKLLGTCILSTCLHSPHVVKGS